MTGDNHLGAVYLAQRQKVLEVDTDLARNGQPLLAIVAQCEVRPGEEVVGDGE